MTDYPQHAVMQTETSDGLKDQYFVDVAHNEDDAKSIELESNFVCWINSDTEHFGNTVS